MTSLLSISDFLAIETDITTGDDLWSICPDENRDTPAVAHPFSSWPSYQWEPTQTPKLSIKTKKARKFAGIIYVLGPETPAAKAASECSVGIAILHDARRRGIASQAIQHVLELAFSTFGYHRVTANVLSADPRALILSKVSQEQNQKKTAAHPEQQYGPVLTENALAFFVGMGFSLEGIRRRAVPGGDSIWRDAHTLCMLDTDWIFARDRRKIREKSSSLSVSSSSTTMNGIASQGCGRTRWDEMIQRHQREQESLAAFERKLKRSSSSETIRADVILAEGSLAPSSAVGTFQASSSERQSLAPDVHATKRACMKFRDNVSGIDSNSDFVSAWDGSSSVFGAPSSISSVQTALDKNLSRSKVVEYLEGLGDRHFTPGPPPLSDDGHSDDDAGDGAFGMNNLRAETRRALAMIANGRRQHESEPTERLDASSGFESDVGDSVSVGPNDPWSEMESEDGDRDEALLRFVPRRRQIFLPYSRAIGIGQGPARARNVIVDEENLAHSQSASVVDLGRAGRSNTPNEGFYFGADVDTNTPSPFRSAENLPVDADDDDDDIDMEMDIGVLSNASSSSDASWDVLSNSESSPPRSVTSAGSTWTDANVSDGV